MSSSPSSKGLRVLAPLVQFLAESSSSSSSSSSSISSSSSSSSSSATVTIAMDLDNEKQHPQSLSLAPSHSSGRTAQQPLQPQPTDDPLDPLNFSRSQKWSCLLIVCWMYFLFTYITTTTVPSFALLQEQYDISLSEVNWTVAIPALGLSVGPLFWSSLADIYGRRIVFIVGTVIALASTVGAALAPAYGGYMAARFFQGFGVSPAATVGCSIVNDLYFEHERGQKLGLWVLALDLGLLLAPLIGGFVALVDQFWVEWVTAIFFGVLLVAELLFLPETLYPRKQMLALDHPPDKDVNSATTDMLSPRTRNLPFLNVRPVPGINTPKPWDTLIHFGRMWTYPNIAIAVFFYCFAWYWWVLTVITYLPVAYGSYTPQIQGVLFLGLILGTLFSEFLFSGTLSDSILRRLSRNDPSLRTPEMRLYLIYPAILLTAIGLILWGISVDKGYHWMVGQVAFFLFAAGIQVGNTAVSAYIVDCYPEHTMSVIVFYSVLLNGSAFASPFFITPWMEGCGFTWSFATQGLITLVVCTPVFIGLQKYGGRMRAWRGRPRWTTADSM